MSKTILITGSTDGIGLETAKLLAAEGHRILLHGRSQEKLDLAAKAVGGKTQCYMADLSDLKNIEAMTAEISKNHQHLDVLINNAGVFKAPNAVTKDGLDIRFVVNTLAPYALTQSLLPLMDGKGRILNLSSAAQAPVNISALRGQQRLSDMDAYAQSKLAITMWSIDQARRLPDGPLVLAINPGSLLASKMVKQGFGVEGNDLAIGAQILRRTALDDEFAASGQYFDNDAGRFAHPHADALDPAKVKDVVETIEQMVASLTKA